MLFPVRHLLALALAAALVTGCSGSDDGCSGRAYHESLDQKGSKTPIQALEVWLGNAEGFDHQPPDKGWIVQDPGEKDPKAVVLTNDDADWWVKAVRTDSGGYVVDEATDDASGCKDRLS